MKNLSIARRRFISAMPLGMAILAAGCVALPGQGASDALVQQGLQLFNAQRYDEAIARFREAIAVDATNWNAWLWLARSYVAMGNWGEATVAARRAFELAPQGPEVLQTYLQTLFGGGSQALAGGNFVDAIKYFSEYLKHNSGHASAWVSVGKAFLGNKQFTDALQALLRALGVAGVDRADVIGTIFSGGVQAFKERDYRAAIDLLREYIKQDPRNLQAYLTLAKSYWESGQRSGALEAFREALRISPTNLEALQFLRLLM